jgi:hypothetical protein
MCAANGLNWHIFFNGVFPIGYPTNVYAYFSFQTDFPHDIIFDLTTQRI